MNVSSTEVSLQPRLQLSQASGHRVWLAASYGGRLQLHEVVAYQILRCRRKSNPATRQDIVQHNLNTNGENLIKKYVNQKKKLGTSYGYQGAPQDGGSSDPLFQDFRKLGRTLGWEDD